MIQKLRSLFLRDRFELMEGHKVIPAFRHQGIEYYKFEDINNLPCGRAFAAIDYYGELQMKCTREYLQAHTTAVNNILTDPKKINIPELAKLNWQLKERLDLIFDIDTIYKLASVVYFDKSEKPYSYDFDYGLKKIAKWKSGGVDDFFFCNRIRELIPLIEASDKDLAAYMKAGEMLNKTNLQEIFTSLLESDKKNDFYKTLKSLMTAE